MNCDDMFRLFEAANKAPTRDQIDRKAVGARHMFVTRAARAMANPDWKDSDRNGISLPNDHQNDSAAPLSLRSGLQGLDLVRTETALLQALDSFDSNRRRRLPHRCYSGGSVLPLGGVVVVVPP